MRLPFFDRSSARIEEVEVDPEWTFVRVFTTAPGGGYGAQRDVPLQRFIDRVEDELLLRLALEEEAPKQRKKVAA